jgi:hypothetical protein
MSLLAFSWGYEGWGNHTEALVAIVDAVEAARGYAPPLFVDIRIRRSVRAVGFRERAFAEQLGSRYRWLRGLGNRAIVEDLADAIVIADPSEAETLVEIIADAAAAQRRVIFFCSCGSPLRAAQCHRAEVARLALAVARRRKLALTIQEWPGGSPLRTSVPAVWKRGTTRLAVPPEVDLVHAAALPHLSVIEDAAGSQLVTGAAVCTARGWALPIYGVAPDTRALARQLVELNLVPRGARIELPPRWRSAQLQGGVQFGKKLP